MGLVDQHAALADPSRLAIAQYLHASDATPGELGQRFAIPSNLMAHHLRSLEKAGLVESHRSEHDARRHYVRLRHEDPAVPELVAVGLGAPTPPTRVLFVCTRNSARSKLAAALWRRVSDVPAADAGTAPAEAPHPMTRRVARRLDLEIDAAMHRVEDTLRGDLVVTVCDHVHETWGGPAGRLHWSVRDPVSSGTEAAFERTAAALSTRIENLATHLLKGSTHVQH